MHRIPRIDLWIWLCIAAGLLLLRLYPTFAPELNHDSFQYLSVADNVLAGHVGYTSLIHYDVERSFGVMPAHSLTFPIGYPLAIALLSLAGLSTGTAALTLSALSTLACIPLLAWLGVRLGLSRALRNLVLAVFVLNGIVNELGVSALSEALFMLLVLLGVAGLVATRPQGSRERWPVWVAAGMAFGAAYFVRYAGLFFIVGLTMLLVRHWLAGDRRLVRGHAIALAVASLFVSIGIARNFLLVGNWRGRDEMLANNPLLPLLIQTGRSMNALFLGVGTSGSAAGGTFIPKAVLLITLVGGIAWLAWKRRGQHSASTDPVRRAPGLTVDLLLMTLAYVACMLYAGRTSEISFGTARNFAPLVPFLALLFGIALDSLVPPHGTATRKGLALLAIPLCCYGYLNWLVIHQPRIDQTAVVAARLNAAAGSAEAPRAAILARTGPHGVILANNGQAVGHVLGRPTVSMVGPTFSRVVWDEATVRATIARFHIAAVVISAPVPGQSDDDLPSPFVRQLAQGEAPPWLKLEQRTDAVLTYVPAVTP